MENFKLNCARGLVFGASGVKKRWADSLKLGSNRDTTGLVGSEALKRERRRMGGSDNFWAFILRGRIYANIGAELNCSGPRGQAEPLIKTGEWCWLELALDRVGGSCGCSLGSSHSPVWVRSPQFSTQHLFSRNCHALWTSVSPPPQTVVSWTVKSMLFLSLWP